MTTPVFNNEPLGDAVLNVWGIEVNTGTTDTPTWTAVRGAYDFKDQMDVKSIDVSDFQAGMWEDSQSTSRGWGCDFKVWRKPVVQTGSPATEATYDPGQEFLRLHNGGSVEIRFFEMGGDGTIAGGVPRVEAHQGRMSVKWAPDGGKHTDARSVSVTLAGKGIRKDIAHPYPNQ